MTGTSNVKGCRQRKWLLVSTKNNIIKHKWFVCYKYKAKAKMIRLSKIDFSEACNYGHVFASLFAACVCFMPFPNFFVVKEFIV